MRCGLGEATERLENELCYDYNYELCSFSNLSVTSPTSQLILQPFRRFTYVTAHSPTLPLLHLLHSSFSIPSFPSPMSGAHSPNFVTLPTSQLILQPFRCFTFVEAHYPTILSLLLRHRLFTYFTWRAAHVESFTKIMFPLQFLIRI